VVKVLAGMSEPVTWSEPPESLSLATGEVHVWRVELEQPEHLLAKFRRTLEEHEIHRASRFHFEKHRRHFIAGRGVLRQLLSRYLDTKPEVLKLSYGAYGKPSLSGEHEDSSLRFNMSHSHEVALFAFAKNCEIGVDVEHVRTDFASEEIARRFFSRREVEMFNAVPEHQQVTAFFKCWTRKEAFIKVIGLGLSQPLDKFDVTLVPEEAAALLWVSGDDASRWSMYDLEVGGDYAGALAVEGRVSNLRYWRFPG
jgi:4'-phosphopantetheinyl transferase